MAALGVHFRGNHRMLSEDRRLQNWIARADAISRRVDSGAGRLSAKSSAESKWKPGPNLPIVKPKPNSKFPVRLETFEGGKSGALTVEKMDEWIRDSVVEIVRNLREAPLLVEVHPERNGGGTRLKTENVVAEDWPAIRTKWKIGQAPSPEGIIMVEELNGGEEEDEEKGNTRLWGVMIQGKGLNCAPCCYLLKTCKVSNNLGLFCTHFCLIKVQNFRETALSQIKNSWLVR